MRLSLSIFTYQYSLHILEVCLSTASLFTSRNQAVANGPAGALAMTVMSELDITTIDLMVIFCCITF